MLRVGTHVRCVLLDVEGTTTPISFVYDTLFPFAAERLPSVFVRVAEEPAIADAVAAMRAEREQERDPDCPAFGDGLPFARWLMSRDRKSTGLKTLQGLIWREGYESGELHAELFDDVPDALAAWCAAGISLRIFSSGSVLAQRLLFAHTGQGDLTHLFDGHYDTTTGPKREASSYAAIAADARELPARVLFLSDVVAELDAAARAGMVTGLMRRPGNAPVDAGDHPVYAEFGEIALAPSGGDQS